ncbi:hypothetical protein JCM9534A_31530 [Catenuloplanes indicus JCM 9534]
MVAGLSGCGLTEEVAAVAAKTPEEVLTASAPGPGAAPFGYTVAGLDAEGTPQHMTGVSSPVAKSYDLATSYEEKEAGFTMNMRFRVVGAESWVRITFDADRDLPGLPELPDRWLKVDPARTGGDADALPTSFTPADVDPGNAGALLATASGVTGTGTGTYAGTLDLTGVTGWEQIDVAKAGDTVEAVPFTATVDPAGQLTALTVEIPAIGAVPAYSYEVTYAYGGATAVAPPAAAETAETPEILYELFNA